MEIENLKFRLPHVIEPNNSEYELLKVIVFY